MTILDQLCLYPKTIDSKCWWEGILDLLWRTWRCAEKQEPCSRLVTYESDQASGVRTLIVSSCQWYDFKCSRLLKNKMKIDWRLQHESKGVWSVFFLSGRIGDFSISTCYGNNLLFGQVEIASWKSPVGNRQLEIASWEIASWNRQLGKSPVKVKNASWDGNRQLGWNRQLEVEIASWVENASWKIEKRHLTFNTTLLLKIFRQVGVWVEYTWKHTNGSKIISSQTSFTYLA